MSAPDPTETRLIALIDAAERAYVSGREDEADRHLAEAQALAPGHPLVLNQTGVHDLRRDRNETARELFERCVALAPKYVPGWINLGSALRALGRREDEMEALARALALDPQNLLVLLQKGSLLELLGKPRASAVYYQQALNRLPPGMNLPTFLEPSVRRAMEVVHANNLELEAFLATKLAGVRETCGAESQARFDHGLAALLGKRRIFAPQPTFLHVPRLPALEFHERDGLPWLATLEAAREDIGREAARLLAEELHEFVPYIDVAGTAPDPWNGLNHSHRLSAYYLWKAGTADQRHLARCPATAALLASAEIPRADVPGYGPTAFFSSLEPKTRIPPHAGATNARALVFLPLVAPPGTYVRSGSDIRPCVAGEPLVFDDTLETEIRNESDSRLVALVFDVWNPLLSGTERELVRGATGGVREYYEGEAPGPAWPI